MFDAFLNCKKNHKGKKVNKLYFVVEILLFLNLFYFDHYVSFILIILIFF